MYASNCCVLDGLGVSTLLQQGLPGAGMFQGILQLPMQQQELLILIISACPR